jgi:hypothetical protein
MTFNLRILSTTTLAVYRRDTDVCGPIRSFHTLAGIRCLELEISEEMKALTLG